MSYCAEFDVGTRIQAAPWHAVVKIKDRWSCVRLRGSLSEKRSVYMPTGAGSVDQTFFMVQKVKYKVWRVFYSFIQLKISAFCINVYDWRICFLCILWISATPFISKQMFRKYAVEKIAYPRARTCGNSNPELTTQSHCTSVRVSGDDKWRASQSKPICTSIRRGAKWGSTCIFLPAEKPYISAKTLPRGDGIRGRQRGEGEEGGPFNSNTWGSKVNV